MRALGAGLLLMSGLAGAAGLQARVCLPSQDLKICLYQDARLAPAELRVYTRGGAQLSRLRVGRLADIRRSALADAGKPVFLLDEDHSAGFGSYSGVETRPFTVSARGLRFAQPPGGDPAKPFILAQALKSGWKESRDGFLLVSCAPDFPAKGKWDGETFRVRYARLTLRDGQWRLSERSERGFWENEGAFPAERLFPK
ncbi:hypothetical protein [Chromobacterium subtsugae]|uniref:hypothetical protein n=1 Tax=Chromobacterium subtsugae TaxID=251747 RepID=UPI0006412405|nr:hypothetical protein [Chromobacterium subtsugae]